MAEQPIIEVQKTGLGPLPTEADSGTGLGPLDTGAESGTGLGPLLGGVEEASQRRTGPWMALKPKVCLVPPIPQSECPPSMFLTLFQAGLTTYKAEYPLVLGRPLPTGTETTCPSPGNVPSPVEEFSGGHQIFPTTAAEFSASNGRCERVFLDIFSAPMDPFLDEGFLSPAAFSTSFWAPHPAKGFLASQGDVEISSGQVGVTRVENCGQKCMRPAFLDNLGGTPPPTNVENLSEIIPFCSVGGDFSQISDVLEPHLSSRFSGSAGNSGHDMTNLEPTPLNGFLASHGGTQKIRGSPMDLIGGDLGSSAIVSTPSLVGHVVDPPLATCDDFGVPADFSAQKSGPTRIIRNPALVKEDLSPFWDAWTPPTPWAEFSAKHFGSSGVPGTPPLHIDGFSSFLCRQNISESPTDFSAEGVLHLDPPPRRTRYLHPKGARISVGPL